MTREEVIEIIKGMQTDNFNHEPEEIVEALDMALKALEQEPCNNCEYKEWLKGEIEQEPCEDCISREKALNLFTWTNTKEDIWNGLKELSSVQPMRPKGKWIPAQYSIEWKTDAKCSNCNNLVAGALGNYVTCPYCSADMR